MSNIAQINEKSNFRPAVKLDSDILLQIQVLEFQNISDGAKEEFIQKRDQLIETYQELNNRKAILGFSNNSLQSIVELKICELGLDKYKEDAIIILQKDIEKFLNDIKELEHFNSIICCDQGKIIQNIDAAQNLLIKENCGFYQRSGVLVYTETIRNLHAKKNHTML